MAAGEVLDALEAHRADLLAARRLYVGFSGGLDSSVLLHALGQAYPDRVTALHANHGLHGDAGNWQRHCTRCCEAWNVPLLSAELDVARGGRGLEAAAREARFAWFAAQLQRGDVLLLAHHQDDQVETLLLRLLRGAGPDGLGAMAERRPLGDGTLLRPFLALPRTTLAAYAQAQGLRWVDDPSNDDDQFDRNYLRQRVLPLLAARWPGYRGSLARAARLARELAELPAAEKPALRRSVVGDPGFAVADLPSEAGAAALALRAWLRDQGLSLPGYARLQEFLRQLREGRGASLAGEGWCLARYRDAVFAHLPVAALPILDEVIAPGQSLAIPGVGRVTLEGSGVEGSHAATALRLRLRRGGERLATAAGDHRDLKAVFQQHAVPPWWRSRVPLLFDVGGAGSELLAVGPFAAAPRWHGQGFRLRWEPPLAGVADGLADRWRVAPGGHFD